MKSVLLSLLCSILCIGVNSQNVSTFFNSASIQIDDALIMDRYGNLYGSHYMGSNVYKVSPNGVATVFASGLNTPNGLAFNSADELYVVDNIGNRIYRLDTSGVRLDTIVVSSPSGIIKSIDSDTMIFTQYTGHTIRKLAPDGTISSPIVSGYPLRGPVGLCYGDDSLLYIGNFTDRKIFKIDSGRLVYVARVPGFSATSLGFITFANGFIYGTAFQENKIYQVDPRYIDSVRLYAGSSAGNTDGPISTARFNSPNGIYASRGGDSLYISDFNTGNVRIISGLITGRHQPTDENESNIKLFPNPASDLLYLRYPENKFNEIRIYNQVGQLEWEQAKAQASIEAIDVGNLAEGVYFIVFHSNQNKVVKKLIISR